MVYEVDFTEVSTIGLESSPVAGALAGLRANEARYFKNKYDHDFTVEPASEARATIDWVHRILKDERDIVIQSRPLEATTFEVENIRMAYVFYESGLSINLVRGGTGGAANCLRMAPPLTISDDDIDLAAEILDASLTAVAAHA